MITLDCLSLGGCRASLDLLERTTYSAAELAERLPALRADAGVVQLAVLSTCQRTEFYVAWADQPDPDRLIKVLAADRGLPVDEVEDAVTWWHGEDCVRHLLRVTSGLESFVLGETEVIGQVRAAAQIARTARVCVGELDALLRTAVSAARRVHRETSFVAAGRSVGTTAVDAAADWWSARGGNGLAGRELVMVGAGQIANAVVARAVQAGAEVTVCNRTLRHAERFAAAGARAVDLTEMANLLGRSDVVLVGTAAPHRLVDVDLLARVRTERSRPLLLVDLSVPRNVDPGVRDVPGVDLVDLADLRGSGSADAATLAEDVALAEAVLGAEQFRFNHWLRSRSAVSMVRQLRAHADDVGRQEYDRVATRLPADARPLLELAVHRTVHRLIHAPTIALLDAAATGDRELVETLARALSRQPEPPTGCPAGGDRLTSGGQQPGAAQTTVDGPCDSPQPGHLSAAE
ncbi:MAG TPA: glutamyl-tRNA reductase [Pseudonocardiaceae bacterium]|nr:glutamyl-tRNA reductase [Pseudonocardiaceae bacterium]